MGALGAVEVGHRLDDLLDRVAAGEVVSLTRDGKEVAQLVPVPSNADKREQARAAAQRIRERAQEMKLGKFDWEEWKAYRDEGRR
jgi:prevent-host-death family protein